MDRGVNLKVYCLQLDYENGTDEICSPISSNNFLSTGQGSSSDAARSIGQRSGT